MLWGPPTLCTSLPSSLPRLISWRPTSRWIKWEYRFTVELSFLIAWKCVGDIVLFVAFIYEQFLWMVFTALHGMQTRSCDDISVCPSVCQTRALWQNGRKICPDFYTMRKIILSRFMRRRMVGGGDPFYLKFWVNRPALERNRRFWTNNCS